jgi:hypothetical protein
MDTLTDLGAGCTVADINPSRIDAYFDVVQVWLQQPLAPRRIAWLRSHCGRGGLKDHNEPAPFDLSYRQRLRLMQPQLPALQYLRELNGVLFNYTEAALDWIFDDQFQKRAADLLARRYLIEKFHRQDSNLVEGVTLYTRRRGARNKITSYADQPSRITGELDCFHIEARMLGVDAIRRAGINSVADLLTFDHRAFWQERLLMYDIDVRKLGRDYYAKVEGRRRRRSARISMHGSYQYDFDLRAGGTILQNLEMDLKERGERIGDSLCTQQALDYLRKSFNMSACLQPIEVSHLWPVHYSMIMGQSSFEMDFPFENRQKTAFTNNISW